MILSRLAFAGSTIALACVLAGCQGDDRSIAVVISMPQQDITGVAKATVVVDYSASDARILVENGGPACAFILPGVDGEFSDDHKGTLTIQTVGPRALRGPADIAACRMKPASRDATAADIQEKLTVRVAAAEDPAGKAIDLAAKAAATRPRAGAAALSESQVETAQAEAVKAAAAAAAATPRAAPGAAGGVQEGAGGAPVQAGPGGRPMGPAGAPPGSGAGGPAVVPPPARPPAARPGAGPGGVLNNPGAMAGNNPASAPIEDAPVPTAQDKDPGYDDSPSDDERAPGYTLEIAVTSAGRFGALQLDITHLGRSGGFIGRGDQIDCVTLVDALAAANYAGERVAKIGLISVQGIRTPASILRCGFRTRESVSPASFQIEVTDASDTGDRSDPLDPPPTVVISSVVRR